MAIVTFWSNGKEETAKTLSIAAIATNMAIDHNYRILLLSTNYNDDTLEGCFWEKAKPKKVLTGLEMPGAIVEFDNGIEGLAKTIKSNKATPELISNYTKIVFKDRLDVLLSIKSSSYDEYQRLRDIYPEILDAANQYYDLVFVDVNKGLDSEFIRDILKKSDLVITNLTQRIKIIDDFMAIREKEKMFLRKNNMILIGRYDRFSKYTAKNIARYMNLKEEINVIPYSTLFFEACNEGQVADFFLRYRTVDESDRNAAFIKEVKKVTERIDYKLQELKMQM
ncbi:MAG: hypothetical protein IJ223_02065 [Clostridia bacterium]|nr:hypothetical protein [Clostridia bacterium]